MAAKMYVVIFMKTHTYTTQINIKEYLNQHLKFEIESTKTFDFQLSLTSDRAVLFNLPWSKNYQVDNYWPVLYER